MTMTTIASSSSRERNASVYHAYCASRKSSLWASSGSLIGSSMMPTLKPMPVMVPPKDVARNEKYSPSSAQMPRALSP